MQEMLCEDDRMAWNESDVQKFLRFRSTTEVQLKLLAVEVTYRFVDRDLIWILNSAGLKPAFCTRS